MKRTLTILTFVLNYLAYAQSDSLPDILIRYSDDKSVAMFGYKKAHLDSISVKTTVAQNSIDSIVEFYTLQYDIIPDSTYFTLIKSHVELDSVRFSELIIKSKLTMYLIKYGNGGAQNYEQLTEKFGVYYHSGGCVYDPSEMERQYTRYMRRLLTIRNGANWEEKYRKEVSKIK